jgi:hypothetical protein
VTHDDPQIACTQRSRRFDELALTYGQNLRTHKPRIPHPSSDRQRQHKVEQPRPEERHKRNRQQDSRERHERIHDDQVQEAVKESTVIARNRAEDQAESERRDHYARPYQH